jgi:coenzyme F420-dependent glucose-6-phosphate dehydrogenase
MPRFFYFCGHEQFQPETLVQHAQLAEEVGFDGALVSEHFHPWVDDASAAGFAWSTLGAIAQATQNLQLATGVTTPLWRYHPAVVAQAAATIDRLSGGRFHLGVGTGENINEGPLGYSFPAYRERAERMREALEIMRRLLDGEKLSYDGKYYQTDRAKLYSPPARRVPIWMAAGGPKSAELAAEWADGVVVSVKDPQDTREKVLDPAREGGASSDFAVCATRWSVFAQDEDEAWSALKPWRGLRAPGRLEAVDPAELREKADNLPREEVLGRYSVVHSVDALVDVYSPLVTQLQADVVTIQITSTDQEATIRLLGEEVLPRLRSL